MKENPNCQLLKDSERYSLYDCGNHIVGKDKPISHGLEKGTFSVRSDVGKKAIKKALNDLGGMKSYISPNDKVYIKTSFSNTFPSPNPEIIKSVVKGAKKLGAEVAIIDNDTPYRPFTNDLVSGSGYYKVVKNFQIPVHNVSKSEKISFDVDGTKFELPKFLFDENAKLINVATMKHDLMSGVSLGQKNLVDLVSPKDSYDADPDALSVAVNKVLKPSFTVLDGSRACLAGNPISCRPDDGDFLLASNDIVCADAWGSKALFYPVDRVKHIHGADKAGIGETNCKEAKKSQNPITVAKNNWKKLAPTPEAVEEFSDAYKSMSNSIGGAKVASMWSKTIVPTIHNIR